MSAAYPAAVDAFLAGAVDITTDPIKAQLVGAGYVYDDSHTSVADLADTVAAPVDVTIDHVTDGTVYCDPIVFPAVAAGTTITGLVVYADGGPLLCFADRRADTVPISIVPDGGDLTFTFARLMKL